MTETAPVQVLLRLKYHPAFAGGVEIGGPGYSLPSLEEPFVFPVVDEVLEALHARGITVEGALGSGSIIVIDAASPMFDLHCRFDGHDDCAVILGDGNGFSGDLRFTGPRGLFVTAGFGWMDAPSRIAVTIDASCAAFFGWGVTSVDSHWRVEGDQVTPGALMIGDDTMIDRGFSARNYESHAIFETETLSVINEPGHVIVGPHCWLGENARITRAARIGAGSVIAPGAMVTGDIPARVAAGGVPAQVVRTGVTWDRARKPSEARMKAIIAAL
jgi:acetyltransferase-like isoleucine patch superfamily enzyme